jgi:benzoyl-CoA reductase/2-hydroxyglutaryl-CoA dehydratase subunit BcrC/BadD/HgdB
MATNELQTTSLLKETMRGYFQRLDACAQEGRKVAWCTSVGPAELLRSFGFEVYFPENHGALLGAARVAGDMIPAATKLGYGDDVCSYLTSDIGAFVQGRTPLAQHYGVAQIPRPDLLVYSTNQCREVQEWFSFYARTLGVPIAGVCPPRHLDEVSQSDIDAVVAQYRALVPLCEQVSGQRFALERFIETVRLSREAAVLWRRVLESAMSAPAPLSFFDGCIHMGPIVVLRGTEEAVEYYRTLLAELETRVASREGVVPQELCRLYWDGMPIWGRLRMLSETRHRHGAVVVASTYCNSWILDTMDERTPFESTARAYTEIFINRSETAKERILTDLAAAYRVDGVIFHDARTCFNNSNARFGMPERFRAATAIPTLVVEGDLCDLRFFSDGQTATKLEAFIEQMIDVHYPV